MAKKKADVEYKVLSALICEDARKDINHKDILIGVYSGNISVRDFPATLALTVWLNLSVTGHGEKALEVRFIGPNKKQLAAGELSFTKKEPKATDTISVSTPHSIFAIEGPGTLKFQIKTPGGRWKDIVTKQIFQRPDTKLS